MVPPNSFLLLCRLLPVQFQEFCCSIGCLVGCSSSTDSHQLLQALKKTMEVSLS